MSVRKIWLSPTSPTTMKGEKNMKCFKITYFISIRDTITITVTAKTYEDACIFAKSYREESFSCIELQEAEL